MNFQVFRAGVVELGLCLKRWDVFLHHLIYDTHRVGSILNFSFDTDIDSGQKTSDSISIFSISVESVKFQWMSEKKTPCSRVG